jgi:quercetin dioxygenase-like cupin family protein
MAAETRKTVKPAHWPSYEVADYEVVAATPELRMVTITLGQGHEVPWHWHTNIADRFFCMQGPMVIETRAPREVMTLRPGETFVVPPKRAHRVTGENGGPCKFSVLQGTGTYDYNPIGGE